MLSLLQSRLWTIIIIMIPIKVFALWWGPIKLINCSYICCISIQQRLNYYHYCDYYCNYCSAATDATTKKNKSNNSDSNNAQASNQSTSSLIWSAMLMVISTLLQRHTKNKTRVKTNCLQTFFAAVHSHIYYLIQMVTWHWPFVPCSYIK